MSWDTRASGSDPPNEERAANNGLQRGPPFVGRERELRQLQSALEGAANGHGTLAMLVGEPGIGKTALCDQLGRYACASGALPLVGHCYEEGSVRQPYQPFVEALRTYVQECDVGALRVDLSAGAADLARMLPTLCERLNVTPRPPADPEEDRFRLLHTATDLLRRAAARRPLVLVLEDLHDADRGTLDLLLYLARNLHGARLLVVGTYRDVEVDRAHPLSAALTELHRASNVERVHLRGLSIDEVLCLLTETIQQRIPQPFAELVHRQTEGNPLFVHEMLRFVLDVGLVERSDGVLRRVGDESLAGRIPEGLRDAVGKRLSRLSGSTNRVLSVASVIGREFDLDVLRPVLGCPAGELEDALQEASAAAMIEERSVVGTTITYRFSHAFFRRTLYDEILAPRRIRLHQQVARALEDVHRGHLDEHAAELAEHYAYSSDASDLAKAAHYGQLAAKRASDVFAYGEAARQLERALVLQDLADPEDKTRRCDLLLALGEALLPTGEAERVITEIAPDALTVAQALGDRSRAFHACRLVLDCFENRGAATNTAQPEYLRWAEQARGYADPGSIEHVHANLALAKAWDTMRHGRLQEAHLLRQEAMALARQHRDSETLFRSALHLLLGNAPQHWDDRVRLAEESDSWPREGVSNRALATMFWYSARLHLARGERARAEELWRQVENLAERSHDLTINLLVPRRDALLAIVDGRLEDAFDVLQRFVQRAAESGVPVIGQQFNLSLLFAPALHLGRADAWLVAFEEYVTLAGAASEAIEFKLARAVCLADVGRVEEARTLVAPRLDQLEGCNGEDETKMYSLVWLLQAAVALERREAARALSARLACVAHVAIGEGCYMSVARVLGDAAAMLSDRAAARAFYGQALIAAGKIRFRPELALTHLRLAELLLRGADHAERSEALEHLEKAIPELGDMKMQPALERALTLRDSQAASPGRSSFGAAAWDSLTLREREIARLMAGGLSNRGIAERLVITEGTVEVHVKHILSKLGVRSRTRIAGRLPPQHFEDQASNSD